MFYVLSDTHLSTNPKTNKSMSVFGQTWDDYMLKIEKNALETLKAQDILLIAGDISWAMSLEEAYEDLMYLHKLPGLKILVRGNHDYWWTTTQKMMKFCKEKGMNSLLFQRFEALRLPLDEHGNLLGFFKEAGKQEAFFDECLGAQPYEKKCEELEKNSVFSIVLASTRAWLNPTDKHFKEKERYIYERELLRLESALRSASQCKEERDVLVVALHYPPMNAEKQSNGFVQLLESYAPNLCLFGHLHGYSARFAFQGEEKGIVYVHTAADALQMKPLLVPLCCPLKKLF